MKKFQCFSVIKYAKKDNYENGFYGYEDYPLITPGKVQGNNLEEIKHSIMNYLCEDDKNAFCERFEEENNRIDYQRLEDADGEAPSKEKLEMWKAGKIDLFVCTYSFYFVESKAANIWE